MAAKYDAQMINETMKKRLNIRNMSVIAHVDHGKSTLTDSLAFRAGLIAESQAGEKRFTDNRVDEQERGITIKSTAVSMYFEMDEKLLGDLKRDGNGFLVNLIDSPGHVDFSSEVTAALRVSDGAMVVVDVIDGCSVQTETVLRQALSERIRPVLIINKIDRAILEQKLDPERLYQRLKSIIDHVNYLIQVYGGVNLESGNEEKAEASASAGATFEQQVLDPLKGNVAFAAGKDGWGFTLTHFAEMLKKKSPNFSWLKRLWGNNYLNTETKKWETSDDITSPTNNLERGFNKFVLEPIYHALNVTLENDYNKLDEMCKKLELSIKLDNEVRTKYHGKDLTKYFMKKWLPAAEAMLELIVIHLPSPIEAQKYRASELYEGPADDEVAVSIRECNPNGHLMIYISKMIPSSKDKNKFFAFGRVFSGTATNGQKVRIMGPEYKPGGDHDLYVKALSSAMVMVGAKSFDVDSVPCGNLIALTGIDKYLVKSGTITTFDLAHNIKTMKFSVSPVVRIAVDPVNPADLVKLVEGLKRLARSDPLVKVEMDKKQYVIAGAGELHLEICLKDLENEYAGVPIRKSDPIVTYKETVLSKSSQTCLAKSGNKHNRIYLTAEPLSEEFCEDVDNEKLNLNMDKRQMVKYLHETHNFELSEARKIWCFGPNQFGPNMLVDMTKGVQSLPDVTDTICAGFQWGCDEGVLAQEPLRGVRFNIEDLEYHRDPAHRKGPQIMPAVRRAMMSSVLTAKPGLLEPVYLVEIRCPDKAVGAVYNLLNKKRGTIFDEQLITGTTLYNMKGYLPVNESNGFTTELRQATSGSAFPQCSFHHWQLLPGDPFDENSKAGQVVKELRKKKDLSAEMPTLDQYLDKL